ncbi:MAG: hypothetical protein ACLFWM_08925 [Actinomycetota bacterium]
MRQVIWRVPNGSRLVGRLDAIAQRHGVSRNRVLTALIETGIQGLEAEEFRQVAERLTERTHRHLGPKVAFQRTAESERVLRDTCRCGPHPRPPVAGEVSHKWPEYLERKREWDARHSQHA